MAAWLARKATTTCLDTLKQQCGNAAASTSSFAEVQYGPCRPQTADRRPRSCADLTATRAQTQTTMQASSGVQVEPAAGRPVSRLPTLPTEILDLIAFHVGRSTYGEGESFPTLCYRVVQADDAWLAQIAAATSEAFSSRAGHSYRPPCVRSTANRYSPATKCQTAVVTGTNHTR